MNVLFVTHYYPPEVNAPATRTHEHLSRWRKAGEGVRVVTCQPNCPTGNVYSGYRNPILGEPDEVDGVKVERVWTLIAANSGTLRRTANYFSFLISACAKGFFLPRPTLIVATSPQFFAGWAGIIVGKIRRIPVVLEVRDVWPQSIAAVGAIKNNWVLRFLVFLEQMMYRWADHIVTVGEGYKTHIEERLGPKRAAGKVSIITNGVDVNKFLPQDADQTFLQKHDLEGKFVCSYVGTIGMAHGLDVVLRAASVLKRKNRDDVVFLMVGDGARREKLEAMSKHLGVDDRVKFLGIVPKEDLPKIMASSDAMLVHLKKDDLFETVLPSKIFEIMAMQRPIIMGVRGEARAIVNEAHAGISMEPECEEDLVAAIERLADNPELADELSESGRKFVSEFYNRDKLADEYLDILYDVAGLERPARLDDSTKKTSRPSLAVLYGAEGDEKSSA